MNEQTKSREELRARRIELEQRGVMLEILGNRLFQRSGTISPKMQEILSALADTGNMESPEDFWL